MSIARPRGWGPTAPLGRRRRTVSPRSRPLTRSVVAIPCGGSPCRDCPFTFREDLCCIHGTMRSKCATGGSRKSCEETKSRRISKAPWPVSAVFCYGVDMKTVMLAGRVFATFLLLLGFIAAFMRFRQGDYRIGEAVIFAIALIAVTVAFFWDWLRSSRNPEKS